MVRLGAEWGRVVMELTVVALKAWLVNLYPMNMELLPLRGLTSSFASNTSRLRYPAFMPGNPTTM